MHWCPDETQMLLAAMPMLSSIITWIKVWSLKIVVAILKK